MSCESFAVVSNVGVVLWLNGSLFLFFNVVETGPNTSNIVWECQMTPLQEESFGQAI